LEPEVHDFALPVPHWRPDRGELDLEQVGDDLLMKLGGCPQLMSS
jgi:hypothetical protein